MKIEKSHPKETKRTQIRAFQLNDLAKIKPLMKDPEIMKYTRFEVPQSDETIEKALNGWVEQPGPELGVWCIEEKSSGDFIGWFMLRKRDLDVPELGYMISPSKAGQGFATEVAQCLVEYGLTTLCYPRVVAVTDAANHASIRILEKCGMTSVPNYNDPHQKKPMLFFEKKQNLN